jgi:hypothetical protein
VLTSVGMRSVIALVLMAGVAFADAKVTVRSTTDNSHSTTGTESSRLQGLMRRTIERIVARAPIKLPGNRHVDASIESLTTEVVGKNIVVTSAIRVVVTDDAGKITSVIGSSARVESLARASRVPSMREEAVVGALEGGYHKVKDRLHGKQAVANR